MIVAIIAALIPLLLSLGIMFSTFEKSKAADICYKALAVDIVVLVLTAIVCILWQIGTK